MMDYEEELATTHLDDYDDDCDYDDATEMQLPGATPVQRLKAR